MQLSNTQLDTPPEVIDLSRNDEAVVFSDGEEDINVAADAGIPPKTLQYETEMYKYLAALYGTNLKTVPENRDLSYGGQTHKLNSFHYRGSSRVRDAISTGRANTKLAYIDVGDDQTVIYRWEIMGCLTTQMRYKVTDHDLFFTTTICTIIISTN